MCRGDRHLIRIWAAKAALNMQWSPSPHVPSEMWIHRVRADALNELV